MVGQTLLRGKIDVFVTIEDQSDNQIQIRVNRPLFEPGLQRSGTRDELAVNTIDTSFLLGQPDVFQIEACEIDQEEAWRMLEAATGEALRQIQQMRRQEGEKLAQDIRSKGETLSRLRKQAEERSETVVDAYRERLMSRVEQILGDDKDACYDEQRIAAEVAIYADKCSVDEELVRLASHLQQLNDILCKTVR